ncbi:hypothetical protein BDZ94DRAFT_1265353 [Collybia nuda]|uniref:Uncharacterized protein n=1 Tax=Collybia nuda TaxID=64659 RepID=A0A9P6CCJ6_9AGAR|nr:hypothetical protein BDZ94DRAFT_1265353 [Collybia nuda]
MSIRRAKQPFQDITDKFVVDSLELPLPIVPTPKPRRRPRAPGGILGAKLRAARNPNIPSSLPPSSPPSTSSRLPWGDHEHDQVHDENACPQHILTSDAPAEDIPDFEYDLGDASQDRDFIADAPENWFQGESTPDAANMSDPFGFFAVERQLKAERAAKPIIETKSAARAWHRATPSNTIDVTASNPPVWDIPSNPSTPHKRVDKRRAIASPNQSSDGFFNPNTSSMPSTPSPSKHPTNTAKGKIAPIGEENDRSEDAIKSVEVDSTIAKTRVSRRLIKKPRSSGDSHTTISHTPLVKRSTRRIPSVRRPTEKPGDRSKNEVLEPPKKNKRTTGTIGKKPVSSGKRGKGKNTKDLDDLEIMKQEKWERERQARLEYFRKLQDYQVEKENVYVI